MLVLSRKVGEKVLIGDGVYVTILHIGANKVRVGIEAPRSVEVCRDDAKEKGNSLKHFSCSAPKSSDIMGDGLSV